MDGFKNLVVTISSKDAKEENYKNKDTQNKHKL